MGKIYCLMGKSSCGKDTIFKELMKDEELRLRPVVTYTTRPRRENEKEGIEYHFIDMDKLQELKENKKIIEIREYNTVSGIWYYCTVNDGQINLNKNNYLVIATLEAYNSFKVYFGRNNVKPIYITLDDGTRLERALKREKNQDSPNYVELCRRFIADNEDFSEKKLLSSEVTEEFYNYELNKCKNDIKNMIAIDIAIN